MDGWVAFVVVLVVGVLVLPPTASAAAAYPAAPKLFVSSSPAYPSPGDNVSIDVLTYAGGELTDAASLPQLTLSNSVYPFANVSLQGLARVGTGHYHAWMILPQVTTGPWERSLFVGVYASASVGGVAVSSSTSVNWIVPGLYLRFFSDVTTISPVQRMHLTAEVYNGTRPVDVDAGSMHFYEVGYVQSSGPMAPNRTATGVYEADVTLDRSWSYGFVANATVNGMQISQALDVYVRPPPPWYPGFNFASYQVWFQSTFANATAIQGYLWVADPWGHTAPDVAVSLTLRPPLVFVNGTTDAQGRLPIRVDLSGGSAVVAGTVGANTPLAVSVYARFPSAACTQSFGMVGSPLVSAADPSVLPDASLRDFLTPGASVTRRYHALNASDLTPLVNAPLNYYLIGFSRETVYATGHAVTDAGGNFSVSFTVPPEKFAILFDLPGTGNPSGVVSYAVASPVMGLDVSRFALGGPTRIKATFAPGAAAWVNTGFGPAVGSIALVTSGSQTWSEWGPSYGCALDYLRPTTGGVNVTFFLPSFLPTSGRFLVVASAVAGGEIVEQYAVLSVGQSASIPVGGTAGFDLTTFLMWSAIGAVVAAIAAIGIWTVLRRRPKTPPEPPPAQPPPPTP